MMLFFDSATWRCSATVAKLKTKSLVSVVHARGTDQDWGEVYMSHGKSQLTIEVGHEGQAKQGRRKSDLDTGRKWLLNGR